MSAKTAKAAPKPAKAKHAPRAPPAPETAKEILRRAKPSKVEARVDAPTPQKGKKAAPRKPGAVAFKRDSPLPLEQNAAKMLKQLRDEHAEFHPSEGKGSFDGGKFEEFFAAEIETEVTRPAEIVHDRIARWRCQCCDAVIPVPRRTTVYHGEYILEHDDVLGLLVNGERWVPKAETPLELVQPGRLRDPWSGDLIRGGKRSV
ncbi:MAG: hypothetical protein LC620_07005 [Halobacteriales archaeon]|nr:hypothetical protein [Halobacteriales archaeon]